MKLNFVSSNGCLGLGWGSIISSSVSLQQLICAYDTKCFILFERAYKILKNGVYFIVTALLFAKLLRVLIYAN